MDNEDIIRRISKIEQQYNQTRSVEAHELYALVNQVFGTKYKTDFCGPCAKRHLDSLIQWRNTLLINKEMERKQAEKNVEEYMEVKNGKKPRKNDPK